MIKFRVVGLAVASGLALSACAGMHPGEAIVVNSSSYSMQKVDDISTSLCTFAVASSMQQGAPQDIAGADARQKAAQTLIQLTVAKSVADEMGVSVPPSEYTLTGEQMANLRKSYSESEAEDLRRVAEMLQHTAALYAAIGAAELGVDPDNGDPQKMAAAGEKAVKQAISDADISIDPRINLNQQAVAEDVRSGGSLSVPVSSLANADVSDFAVSQRCS